MVDRMQRFLVSSIILTSGKMCFAVADTGKHYSDLHYNMVVEAVGMVSYTIHEKNMHTLAQRMWISKM